MSERHVLRVAVYLLLQKDGKVLLLRRFNTGWQDGKWSMVAGHVEPDETLTQSTIREAKEEAGIELLPADISLVHTMHRKSLNCEYMDIFFEARAWLGEPHIGEPDKCDAMKWFSPDALPVQTLPYIREGIAHALRGIPYSECGWHGDAI